jgi:hypothetical protein
MATLTPAGIFAYGTGILHRQQDVRDKDPRLVPKVNVYVEEQGSHTSIQIEVYQIFTTHYDYEWCSEDF